MLPAGCDARVSYEGGFGEGEEKNKDGSLSTKSHHFFDEGRY